MLLKSIFENNIVNKNIKQTYTTPRIQTPYQTTADNISFITIHDIKMNNKTYT